MTSMEKSSHGDDRVGQLARVRRRLRAGDGVRLPHRRRVGDVRPAGDQPGDHPGLRRHAAAAAAGRRGQGARDEPARRRRSAPTRRCASAWSTRSCRTTSCSTPRCRGRASSPSRRRSRSRRSSRSRTRASSARASRSRPRRSARRSGHRGRQGGHRRLPGQAPGEVPGQVVLDGSRCIDVGGAARGAAPLVRARRRADRRGDLGAVRDPRLPHARQGAVGEGQPDGGRAHRRVPARAGPLLALLRQPLRVAARQVEPNRAHEIVAELERRGTRARRDHAEHRPAAPRGRVARTWSRCTGRSSGASAPSAAARSASTTVMEHAGGGRGAPECVACIAPLKPNVVLFGELLPERGDDRGARAGRGGRPDGLHRVVARGLPGGRRCRRWRRRAGGARAR